jgi:hypothetical protein
MWENKIEQSNQTYKKEEKTESLKNAKSSKIENVAGSNINTEVNANNLVFLSLYIGYFYVSVSAHFSA